MKLRGKWSCIELNSIIKCVSSGRSRGVRGEEIVNLCTIFLSVKFKNERFWRKNSPRIQYYSISSTINDWDFWSSLQYDKTPQDPWLTRFRTPKYSTFSWYSLNPMHMPAPAIDRWSRGRLYRTCSPTSHASWNCHEIFRRSKSATLGKHRGSNKKKVNVQIEVVSEVKYRSIS